jgi:hypothetical protein
MSMSSPAPGSAAAKSFFETLYASGFPVKPIILGKIIGFGVSDFNEIGHRPKSRF